MPVSTTAKEHTEYEPAKPQAIEISDLPGVFAKGQGQSRPYPLALLHGAFGQHEQFDNYLRFFSAVGFDCYAVSLRGRRGAPPKNAAGVRMQDYLNDTLRVLDDVRQEAIVIGHSTGGQLALQVAERGRCRAAVLLAPVAPANVPAPPYVRSLLRLLRYLPDMLRGRSFVPAYATADYLWFNRLAERDRRRVYEGLVAESGVAARESLAAIRVDANAVRCPLLCVTGLDDRGVPPRAVRSVARKYNADLREYGNHAHWLMEEPGWEAIAQDILTWLETKDLA